MFAFRFTVTLNNDLLTKRMELVVRRIMKKALFLAVREWHIKYAKLHFMRAAYAIYPAEYVKRKKRGGRPLFVSGTLEDQILKQSRRISGTADRVTLKLLLGRPAQYRGEQLRLKVIARMAYQLSRGIKEKYKEAEANILKRAGYGTKLRNYFQKLITAVNSREEQKLAEFVKKYMVLKFRKLRGTGKKERKRIS